MSAASEIDISFFEALFAKDSGELTITPQPIQITFITLHTELAETDVHVVLAQKLDTHERTHRQTDRQTAR